MVYVIVAHRSFDFFSEKSRSKKLKKHDTIKEVIVPLKIDKNCHFVEKIFSRLQLHLTVAIKFFNINLKCSQNQFL